MSQWILTTDVPLTAALTELAGTREPNSVVCHFLGVQLKSNRSASPGHLNLIESVAYVVEGNGISCGVEDECATDTQNSFTFQS